MGNIAIIGGGFTGLAAARYLCKSGHKVSVFESGPELGGLAACFSIGGEPIEKAYHHLFRTDREIIQLVEELGMSRELEWCPSSVAIYRGGKIWPFMSPFDLLRFGPCSLVGRIRTGLVALYLQKTRNWRKFVNRSALQWMNDFCGSSSTNAIWGPLLKGKFAHHAERVSMAWLWARLHVRSNSREPGEGEKLGYIKGGFIRIIEAIEGELLSFGATIHRSSRIDSISNREGTPSIFVGGRELSFDAVLFTGSNRSFERLIRPGMELGDYSEKLGQIDYLGAVCHVFSSSQNLGRYYWVNVNDEAAPFLVFIQHTNLVPESRYKGKHIYYIGAYLSQSEGRFLQPDAELLEEWYSYLRKMYPAFDPLLVDESNLFRFRDAQHVVDLDYEAKISSFRTPLKGVFLSNFSQIFPEDRGTNFAVREGNRAGTEIDDFLQIR